MGRAAGDGRTYRLAIVDSDGNVRPDPSFELVSVSTIAGMIKSADPLIGWAFNVTSEGAKHAADQGYNPSSYTLDQFRALLKELGFSPYKARDKAATRGSGVHDYFEARLRDPGYLKSLGADASEINPASNPILDPRDIREATPLEERGYLDGVDAFIEAERPTPVLLERPVVSLEHRFAGTFDAYCYRKDAGGNDTLRLSDLKTSKRVYDSHHLQNSGYQIALEEEGFEVDERSIIRVSADGGYQEVIDKKPMAERRDVFVALVKLYHLTGGKF